MEDHIAPPGCIGTCEDSGQVTVLRDEDDLPTALPCLKDGLRPRRLLKRKAHGDGWVDLAAGEVREHRRDIGLELVRMLPTHRVDLVERDGTSIGDQPERREAGHRVDDPQQRDAALRDGRADTIGDKATTRTEHPVRAVKAHAPDPVEDRVDSPAGQGANPPGEIRVAIVERVGAKLGYQVVLPP
jgi:hypothetical protein